MYSETHTDIKDIKQNFFLYFPQISSDLDTIQYIQFSCNAVQ